MKKLLLRWAGPSLIFILFLGMGYQLLVFGGVLSAANTWGGQLANETSRRVGVVVSLVMQTAILTLLLMRLGIMKTSLSSQTLTRWMYGIAAIFSLNTIGNMMASNALEQAIGTPLTGIAAILFYWLAANPQAGKP